MVPVQIRAVFNPVGLVWRVLIKGGVMALVVLAVVYPRPDLLVRNIAHWRDLDALIDPVAPGLAELEAELMPRLAAVSEGMDGETVGGVTRDGRATLRVVQAYVLEKIPFAWDWETWGVVDYVPTVAETLAAGREDCDGRAVLAASLLRRLGYEARLRSDLSHVWVWTPQGETMSPVQTASGRTVIGPGAAGVEGARIDWSAVFAWATLVKDMPTSIGYGIAVFPLWREGIVILAGCVVLAGRRARVGKELAAAGLVVAGLIVIRWTCEDAWARDLAGAWAGFVLGGAGILVMLVGERAGVAAITGADVVGVAGEGEAAGALVR